MAEKRPLSVLVVDDDDQARHATVRILQLAGYATRAAPDGAQALAAMRTGRFDLVLMDLEMPVMNGVEAVARIRAGEAQEGAERTAVLAHTGSDIERPDAFCDAHGFDGVIPKGAGPLAVREAVDAYFAARGRWPG